MGGRTATGVIVAALAVTLLTGCSGGEQPSATSADAAGGGAPGEQRGADGSAAGSAKDPSNAAGGRAAPIGEAALARREVVYTADLTIRVPDVAKAVFDVEGIAERAGGHVAESQHSSGDAGNEAHIRLRTPPDEYQGVLTALSGVGAVESRSLSAEDKTSEVVDVESRIADQRKSIARVRGLMDRARTLQDVVALESELARRESEL